MDVTFLAGKIGANRRPIVLATPAFQMTEEIELHIAWLKYVVARQRRCLTHVQRMHEHGRHENDQFLFAGA